MQAVTFTWLPQDDTLFGIHNQFCDAFPVGEDGEADFNEEPVPVGKFAIGLILLTINIYYRRW